MDEKESQRWWAEIQVSVSRAKAEAKLKAALEGMSDGETHSEEHYCPVCKGKTTFIGRGSWGFCSRCGYKEEKEGRE